MRRTGLVSLWHVGSSQTRKRTSVPCIGRQILITGPSGKPQQCFILAILLGVYNDLTVVLGLPGSSAAKESTYNVGDPASIPGSKILWRRDRLRTPVFLGFPGGSAGKESPAIWETWVRSLGWEDPLEKKRRPTPVFWPGEFHELYSPWGHKELDTIDRISLSLS